MGRLNLKEAPKLITNQHGAPRFERAPKFTVNQHGAPRFLPNQLCFFTQPIRMGCLEFQPIKNWLQNGRLKGYTILLMELSTVNLQAEFRKFLFGYLEVVVAPAN